MMSKLNSTLCDNSFIDSSFIGLNGRDYSMSFARGLPQGDWRDRESVKVAPEQLDEA